MSKPGDVFVDFEDQLLKYDDGAAIRALLRSGSGFTIASESPYNCRPNTGTDMTAEIQTVADQAPDGSTVIMDAGTYIATGDIIWSRNVNLLAYGVTIDIQSSTPALTIAPGIPQNHDGVKFLTVAEREASGLVDRAAFMWGISSTNRPVRNFIKGLKITRTASANTAAARLHLGFVCFAPFECLLEAVEVSNFFAGFVFMGGTAGEGMAYNAIRNLKTTDCRYGRTLYGAPSTGNGYANQNIFENCRDQVTSTIRNDTSYNAGQWEHLRLLWEGGDTAPAPPNGNTFINDTMESPVGRKVRCEGRHNVFINERMENTNPSAIVEILDDTDVDNSPTANVWDVTGGVAVTTLATVTANGTLTQQAASFVVAVTASAGYILTYTATSSSFVGTLALSGICNSLAGLPVTTGTHQVAFSTKASPTDLIMTFTRSSGSLTVDNISLKGMPDITVGESSRANSWFTRNYFLMGDELNFIMDRSNVEFLSTVAGANNGNTFVSGTHNLYSARQDTLANPAHRFHTTGSTGAVMGFSGSTNPDVILLHHVYASLSAQGAFEFRDTGGVVRNAIGMSTASPYDLRTLAGLNIGNLFRVRLDGSIDAIIANPNTGGLFLIPVGTGHVRAWASDEDDLVLAIADSNRDSRIEFLARDTVGASTYIGAIRFYDDDATPTLKNVLGISASADLPGGSGQRPLLVKWGIDVNEQQANADSRIKGQGLADLFYVDASADRVLIGQATGAEQFDVNLDARMRSLRLDGDTGAGVASTVTHTNLVTAVGGATGTATLGLVGNANTPAAVAQTGWIKIYDGTTVKYIPCWT